jgi:hypothetical protein
MIFTRQLIHKITTWFPNWRHEEITNEIGNDESGDVHMKNVRKEESDGVDDIHQESYGRQPPSPYDESLSATTQKRKTHENLMKTCGTESMTFNIYEIYMKTTK